jgi:hypothetical protein
VKPSVQLPVCWRLPLESGSAKVAVDVLVSRPAAS